MGLSLNGFLRITVPEQHKLDSVYQLTLNLRWLFSGMLTANAVQ